MLRNAERARQPRNVAHRKLVQMLVDDALRQLVNCGTGGIIVFAQLEQQAFAQVARTHASWLERLHKLQRDSHLVVVGRWLQAR